MCEYNLPFHTDLYAIYPIRLPVGHMPPTDALYRSYNRDKILTLVLDERPRVPLDTLPFPEGVTEEWLETQIVILEFDTREEYEGYVTRVIAGARADRRTDKGDDPNEGGAGVTVRPRFPKDPLIAGAARIFEEALEAPRNP
jgi:hypothetical protein